MCVCGGDQLLIWKIPLLTMFLSSDRILPFLLPAGICGKLGNLAGTNIQNYVCVEHNVAQQE